MDQHNRILVVDDEHEVIDVLRENLETDHLDILTANSGEEALKLFRMAPIDVVVSDIKMPGMSGLELAHEIAAVQNRYPYLIYVTATPMDAQEMYIAGADSFLRKPIDFDLLKAVIEHFLGRAKLEKSLRSVKSRGGATLQAIETEAQKLLGQASAQPSAQKILELTDSLKNLWK